MSKGSGNLRGSSGKFGEPLGNLRGSSGKSVETFGEPSGKFGEVRGTFGEGPGRSKKASDPIQFYIRSIRLHLGQT